MTALKEYERLETTGLWRETPEAQRRDVLLSFGKATIIISDKSDTVLTHWSLPAIERVNPGKRPAIFQPGAESGETLEVDDPLMIDAIEKVRKTIARRKPHHGRLRFATFAIIVAMIAALGLFWLPGALVRHTVSVVPDSTRLAIGTSLLGHLSRLTGDTCRNKLGLNALARLKSRVLATNMHSVYVVPGGGRDTLYLPGGLLLLNRTLVEDYEAPDVVAGYMLAAAERASDNDPIRTLLETAGVGPTFHLLTTGKISDDILSDYAQVLLTSPDTPPAAAQLVDRFATAKVAMSPYAYALDVTGETTLDLIEADPYGGVTPPRLISDGDWVSLQAICEE